MILSDPAATHAAGLALAPHLRAGDVVALQGDLGAGKTSFARGILAGLGLTGEAPSPTFAIVIPYDPPDVRLPVAHIDLYRLDDPAQARELGLDDMREDGVLLIEWPERIGDLRGDVLQLAFAPTPEGARRLTWVLPPSWEERWPL